MNEKLIEALSSYCDPDAEIQEESELVADLGMTSFDLIQAMGDLEDMIGRTIDMEALSGVTTVGDLNQAIRTLLAGD